MATTAMSSVRFLLPSHVLKGGPQPWHDAVPDQQVAVGLGGACGRGPDHEEEEEEKKCYLQPNSFGFYESWKFLALAPLPFPLNREVPIYEDTTTT